MAGRQWAGLIAAGVMISGGIAVVGPAAAVEASDSCAALEVPLTSSGAGGGSSTITGGGTLNAGEVLVLNVTDLTGTVSVSIRYGGSAVGSPLTALGTTTFEVPSTADASFGVGMTFPGGGGSASAVLTCITPSTPATPAATGASAPPAWYQSYARADKDGSCIAGWHPSYAMWPNNGSGGWVCDKTVEYDAASGTWSTN